jgi:2-haloacid dehalogenase
MNNSETSVIIFDVNETLLDMSPMKKKINSLLGSKRGFRIWFGLLLQYSLVENSTGEYHDFTTIANSTIDMAAKALKANIEEEEKTEALALMKQLPAYPDVEEGLEMLREAGFRLATLSNSSSSTLREQLHYSCLAGYFQEALSVDDVRKYKPSPEPYQYAAEKLGIQLNQAVMVAAHGWDIAGATHAGMKSAFVERKGQSLYSLASNPDFIGEDLVQIAELIIANRN